MEQYLIVAMESPYRCAAVDLYIVAWRMTARTHLSSDAAMRAVRSEQTGTASGKSCSRRSFREIHIEPDLMSGTNSEANQLTTTTAAINDMHNAKESGWKKR